jgi:hypothetical protein
MPKRSRSKQGKKLDVNELAKQLVDEATSEEPEQEDYAGKNPDAVRLGRLGGLKGGKARWKGTTQKERSEAARKAAQARWKNKKLKQ